MIDMQWKNKEALYFLYQLRRQIDIPLIGNLGPKIPIRFHVIGDVHADMETRD